MATSRRIGTRVIGEGAPLIIAELGVNHNGRLDVALAMVKAAHKAGCDAVKIQAYHAEEFCDPAATYTYRQPHLSPTATVTEKQVDMFRRCQLTREQIESIHDECRKLGLLFVATACDEEWISVLEGMVDAFKVGSDDLTHLPLLRRLARMDAPVILSTGMACEEEIGAALDVVGHNTAALLHCVSLYPTPIQQVNLSRMTSLCSFGVPVGFSDHSEGTLAALAALMMGAAVLEKHFTLNKALSGPDHWFSGTPSEFTTLREVYVGVLGSGAIAPSADETKMLQLARRSIVAALDVSPGTVISPGHLAFRRPGTGIPPTQVDAIVGRVALRSIKAGAQLTVDDVFEQAMGEPS